MVVVHRMTKFKKFTPKFAQVRDFPHLGVGVHVGPHTTYMYASSPGFHKRDCSPTDGVIPSPPPKPKGLLPR